MADLSVRVRQRGSSASEGQVRNHRVPIDRLEEKGGGDQGPMGGELFLLGLGGCYMSNLLAAIHARQSPISDLVVDVIVKADSTPQRFVEFTLEVSGRYESRAEMEKLALIAERSCIVANTLKSFLPVTVRVK